MLSNYGGRYKVEENYKALIPGGESGFLAKFGRYRGFNGEYTPSRRDAHFWSSSEDDDLSAWILIFFANRDKAGICGAPKDLGFSVRCIKD